MADNNNEDAAKKYEISAEMFEHMWQVNEHEDTKAGRILESMAFLSITAATALLAFLSRQGSVEFTFGNYSFSLISISFGGFAIFVALGIIIFLESSLRGIEKQNKLQNVSILKKKDDQKRFEPQSIFYFKKISEETLDQWTSYFTGSSVDLMNKAYRDHIRETFVMSGKTRTKVKYYKIGKVCFYIAIVFFIMLIVSGCYALR